MKAIIEFPDGTQATVTPDGWQCEDELYLEVLNAVCPFEENTFHPMWANPLGRLADMAAEKLGCEVIEKPEPTSEPGVMY